jgi:predicted TIM-barrel fold metal-dependent hydrolase
MDIAGEDNLVIGTDYGHADSASELRALDGVLKNSKFSSSVADKIVGANAKALYSL